MQPTASGDVRKEFPVHFFTIVLNGEPFVRWHLEQMKKLPFLWHWHVVEGVAALTHDTGWSLATGGRVPGGHRGGRSADGTAEYLDEAVRAFPGNVTIYRKPPGQLWDGKREMVGAPLANILEECLLWEIDVDELWTAEQFVAGRQLFLDHPEKTAARYWCWFFVGPELVTTTRHCYANSATEWLRTWRYRPGMRWAKHEPPVLAEPLGEGQWRDVAAVNAFTQDETEAASLVFQHYAYTTLQQLQFKEQYYGYHQAVRRWFELQRAALPARLGDYFPWVQDGTLVNRVPPSFKRLMELTAPVEPATDAPEVREMQVVGKTASGAHLVSFNRPINPKG